MKQDTSIYSDIINSLKTTQEAEDFSSEIDMAITGLFKSGKMPFEKILQSMNPVFIKKIIQIFSRKNLDYSKKEAVQNFLENLKESIKELKIIKLVLAFNPTFRTIGNIHDFVSEKIGKGYILDIEVSEDILGGAVVIFNGKYNDFSLKKTLGEAFNQKSIQNL